MLAYCKRCTCAITDNPKLLWSTYLVHSITTLLNSKFKSVMNQCILLFLSGLLGTFPISYRTFSFLSMPSQDRSSKLANKGHLIMIFSKQGVYNMFLNNIQLLLVAKINILPVRLFYIESTISLHEQY